MEITPELRKRLMEFHGDGCPISLLGARMGYAAMEHFGIDERHPRNFVIITETPSCLLDGIQFATGCTVGSGNIIPENYGKLGAVFYRRKEDRAIRTTLAKSLREEFEEIGDSIIKDMLKGERWGRDERKTALVKRFMKMPDDELLNIEEVEMAREITSPETEEFLLRRGFIVHRKRCEACGEYVEETRMEGALCTPCAGKALYRRKEG